MDDETLEEIRLLKEELEELPEKIAKQISEDLCDKILLQVERILLQEKIEELFEEE